MRKRGRQIRHKAAAAPGLVAQSIFPEYEIRLRGAVASLTQGWCGEDQFNDLADTCDLLALGLAIPSFAKPDPSAEAARTAAQIALMNIRDRWVQKGKFGATADEAAAVALLADVSYDFWNRRSGALFAEAYRQLTKIRHKQREIALAQKQEAAA